MIDSATQEKYHIKNHKDIKGKVVLLRLDTNISLGGNGHVDPGEDWRLLRSFRTLDHLISAGAKVVILGHIGRDPKETLKPIHEYLQQSYTVAFVPHWADSVVAISDMESGDCILLENVRAHKGEKEDDPEYLKDIIDVADLYVNEAFSVSHRKHASVSAITKYLPSYLGFQCVDELEQFSEFMRLKDGVKVLVLGGAKFGTKLSLLRKMLPDLDYVLMGGALANVFLKAREFKIGKSFCDDVDISDIAHSDKIILPIDYIDEHGDVADIYDVGSGNMILDIGPATLEVFSHVIENAQSILWNGPMGKYEDSYVEGSIKMAQMIGSSFATAITGGGDTSTVILEQGLEEDFSFISTGGGAMLDLLVDGELVAITSLIQNN